MTLSAEDCIRPIRCVICNATGSGALIETDTADNLAFICKSCKQKIQEI